MEEWCQIDPCRFSKNEFFRDKGGTLFFIICNIIINYTFHENVIEISQVIQNIWRFSPSILKIYTVVQSYFGIRLVLLEIRRKKKGTKSSPARKKFSKKPSLISVEPVVKVFTLSKSKLSTLVLILAKSVFNICVYIPIPTVLFISAFAA